MWYPMRDDGVEVLDSIGRVFPILKEQLNEKKRANRKHLDKDSLDPSLEVDKLRLFLIHDLIFMAGPLTNASLIDLIKILFGDKEYNTVHEALALLTALEFIDYSRSGDPIQSKRLSPFLNFENLEFFQVNFRMIRLRNLLRGRAQ